MLKRILGLAFAFVVSGLPPAGATGTGVLQHHNDAARSGVYRIAGLTRARAAHLQRDRNFDGRVPGEINAQPLYWKPEHGRATVIVATEDNIVAALDAETGRTVWQHRLGPPVPRSRLPCGNISPLGITGTPVIDPQRKAMFFDAAMLVDGEPRHRVFGLSLEDGSTLAGWPVDVQRAVRGAGGRFDSRVQNQRSALALAHGTVYVAYSGHFGDCGDYHGWVIGLPLEQPERIVSFMTRARGGGIWAPGGISAAGGDLFVATGNTFGAEQWQDGEAVFRLTPDLQARRRPADFFAPRDWQALDARDLDLGGANPMPVTVPGATPSELVLALGKDGKAYLLDRANLGGIGGALRVAQVSNAPIRTAPAAYGARNGTYIAFHGRPRGCPGGSGGNIAALRIEPGRPPTMHIAWCAEVSGRGSPMVTTDEGGHDPIVWVVGAEGDNRLHGLDGETGDVVFNGGGSAMINVGHFQTPIAAGGRIYVAADGRVYAFSF